MVEIQPMVSGEAAQVRAILIAGLTERWGVLRRWLQSRY